MSRFNDAITQEELIAQREREADSETTTLYVIEHPHGFYKIGKSDDPESRLNQLQVSCPYELKITHTIDVINDWRIVEDRLHELYEDNIVRGEWFELEPKTIWHLQQIHEINSKFVDAIPEWDPEYFYNMNESKKLSWLLRGDSEIRDDADGVTIVGDPDEIDAADFFTEGGDIDG